MTAIDTPRLSLYTLFFLIKLIFVCLSNGQSTDAEDWIASGQEKFETGSMEARREADWRPEGANYGSLLNNFMGKTQRFVKGTFRLIKRKAIPNHHGEIKDEIAKALEQHIEGMEPHFKSASFQWLWQELRQPLTKVIRPRKQEEMLSDLDECKLKLGNDLHPYEYPTDIDIIKRDLSICKIGEILEKNIESSSEPEHSYAQIWRLLKNPLDGCFKVAQLSSLINELTQCLPRFELAGIKYKMPSKMSEVKRDVVICKVDEVLHESHNYNVL